MSGASSPPRSVRPLLGAYLALCGAQLILSGTLEWIHLRLFIDPAYEAFCHTGTVLDCQAVALSASAVQLGVPVAVWGLLGALLAAVLGGVALYERRRGGCVALAAASLVTALMSVVALGLMVLSASTVGAFCQLCLLSHLVTFSLAIVAALAAGRACGGGYFSQVRVVFTWARRSPVSALVWLVVPLLAGVALHLFLPRYWEIASFRSPVTVATGVTDDGAPWIGAANPVLVVDEYHDYECPFCRAVHLKLRRMVERYPSALRLVRHDTSRVSCPSSPPAKAPQAVDACRTVRGAYCAAVQGRFWQWNDASLRRPRPAPSPARLTYEEDLAADIGLDRERLARCLASPEAFSFAAKAYKDAVLARAKALPAHRINGRRVSLSQVEEALAGL